MDHNELSRLVGSLCLMGIDGTSVNADSRELIETHSVGAILLTSKNLECECNYRDFYNENRAKIGENTAAEQAQQLIFDLQTTAFNSGYERPLLIAIDQEGGSINSLNADEITQFPSAMGLAATGQQDLAEKVAHAMAQELKCLGFNWILGPVLDVLPTNKVQQMGVRTFGDDPFVAGSYGAHMVRGFKNGGLATGCKHFPGYGDTSFPDDSPENVPCIPYSKAQLHQNQLVPFREAIQHNVDAILVGGCAMTGLGAETVPHACLSKKVVTDLLRHELGFSGVIVSECLAMEALCENIGVSQGATMAILAGCDFALVCQTYQTQLEALSGLKLGVQSGHIPIQLVNAAVERINSLKDSLTSWDEALYPGGLSRINEVRKDHGEISLLAYKQSMSIIRDTNANLSGMSTTDDILLLTPLLDLFPSTLTKRHHETDWTTRTGHLAVGEDIFQEFGSSLANARKAPLTHTSYSSNGLRPSHEALIATATAVIIITADVTRNTYQYGVTKYLNMICKSQKDRHGYPKPLIVVAVSSPYDFLEDLDIETYICLYDYTKPALDCLVDLLTGKCRPLPTGIPPLASMRRQRKKKNSSNSNVGIQPKGQLLGQTWLVEKYNHERDGPALQRLFKEIPEIQQQQKYQWASMSDFETRMDGIEANHFVVKNSSNGTVHGFCATYYLDSISQAYIATCMVNPHRRRMGIGGSIATYAITWLSENKTPKQIQWGCPFPAFFSTFPLDQRDSTQRADIWMNYCGWSKVPTQTSRFSMRVDLSTWSSALLDIDPTGFTWEVVDGPRHSGLSELKSFLELESLAQNKIIDNLSSNVHVPAALVRGIYMMAILDQTRSAILMARARNSLAIVGAVAIYFKQWHSSSNILPSHNNNRRDACWAGALMISSGLDQYSSTRLAQFLLSSAGVIARHKNCQVMVVEWLNHEQMNALASVGFEKEKEWVQPNYYRLET